MKNTKIEWATHTFNPWEGCTKISPACDHCYAERRNARFGGGQAPNWGPGAPRRRTSAANWRQPLRWNAEANRNGTRPRVFCASLADVFDNEVSQHWRADLFHLIHSTPQLDWLLLTKRIGNAPAMIREATTPALAASARDSFPKWPWKNVWLGATVVNQEEADRDIPKLLTTPAAKRFLSVEPMLGPVDIGPWLDDGSNHMALAGTIDWVIVGGESGPSARPCHDEWIRSIRKECMSHHVPCFVKQLGQNAFYRGAGCPETGQDVRYVWTESVKGGNPVEWPQDLQVRQFPDPEV